MNWDQIAGDWKQLQEHIQSQWPKLTGDDLQKVPATKDAFVGKIQERYGVLKDDAERQVDAWIAKGNRRPGAPNGPGAPTENDPSISPSERAQNRNAPRPGFKGPP